MARVGFPPSKSPEVGRSSVEAAKGRQEGFALEEPCLAVTSAQQWNPEWGIKTPQGSTGYFGSHRDSQISQLLCVIRQGVYEGMGDLSPRLYLNTSIRQEDPCPEPCKHRTFGGHSRRGSASVIPISHLNTHSSPAHPARADSYSPALKAREKEPFPARSTTRNPRSGTALLQASKNTCSSVLGTARA